MAVWQDWSKENYCSAFWGCLVFPAVRSRIKDTPITGSVMLSEPNLRILVDLFQAMNSAVLGFLG